MCNSKDNGGAGLSGYQGFNMALLATGMAYCPRPIFYGCPNSEDNWDVMGQIPQLILPSSAFSSSGSKAIWRARIPNKVKLFL